MRFEDLSVTVRPRNPWEAMDLGLRMLQRWWRDLLPAWLIISLPLFILFNIIFRDNPGWALILTWWCKPLYDRVLLLVYSRRVFGQQVNIQEVFAALPDLLWRSGLWLHLTIYRLDFTRSFRLPIWQLEGLRGKSRSKRVYALSGRAGGYATWLTLICLHLEAFLQLALVGLLWMFTPEVIVQSVWEYFWNLMAGESFPYWFLLSVNIVYYLGVTIIEPFFVAAGFALYLNRRTLLEGWDIEIAFRRLANRIKSFGRNTGRIAASLLLTGILSAYCLPQPLQAEEITTDKEALSAQRLAASDSGEVIRQVLQDKDFGGERMTEEWALKEFERTAMDKPELDLGWIADIIRSLANLTEVLLWVGIILLALFLISRIARMVNPPGKDQRARNIPAVISGLDIRPESLPDDVAGTARALWQQGQYREALSLLYRGTVSSLVHHYEVNLTEGATEGDVLQASGPLLANETLDLLRQITRSWQTIAYAHRQPDDRQAQQVFSAWNSHFGPSASLSEGSTG